ncbi:hypothetical protein FGB62_147g04 [Gracilaria domingensis]|nr:hypothetical protein FGB62_147g04 [Gracilaria domingensis]
MSDTDTRSSAANPAVLDMEAVKEVAQPGRNPIAQDATHAVPEDVVGFGFLRELIEELETHLRRLGQGTDGASPHVGILNDLIGQMPTLYVRALLRGILFTTHVRLINAARLLVPLLRLLKERLGK